MAILIIAEHDNLKINVATLNAVTAAQAIGGDIEILVAGKNCTAVGEMATKIAGVTKVRLADSSEYENALAENMAGLIVNMATEYSHILATATASAKNIMPRVAALLDKQQISEITDVIDDATFVRPIYAGNAMATVKSSDLIKIITVRGTAFEAAQETGGNATIQAVDPSGDTGLSSYIGSELSASERPDLTSARIVVSGGRGMQSGDNFPIIESVADKLGAAVGASRAAVDAGYVPNDYQVGQTGKVVAPDLYIAVGISGAIQHLAGMKDSKVIVAINKDEEAPIFQVADFGLVADLFTAVPELDQELIKNGFDT